jgi:hypothetical protein
MDLQTLAQQVESLDSEPPFHLWSPTNCGDIDMVIKPDGTWFHQGTPIGRIKLVKLFAKVLIQEDGDYFLKTPAEKMRIQVEDAPFVITQWQLHNTEEGQAIEVESNLNHKLLLGEQHPIVIEQNAGEPQLYVILNRGLKAKVHRNVYYQWIENAQEKTINGKAHLVVQSANCEFSLGSLEE